MDAELNTALRRAIAKSPDPARPSEYFRWLDEIAPCDVVLFARESSRQQHARGNLDCQIERLRRQLRGRGFKVLKVFDEIGSGWLPNRPALELAVEFARRHNAIVIAEATNRYVRPYYYHPRSFPNAPYLDSGLKRIARIGDGVTLATFLHPDTPEREVRSYQTRRGISERARAARPAGYKKARRDSMAPRAVRLAMAGLTIREVAEVLDVHPATIGRWIKLKNETPGNQGS